jgi:hypothetical protein
VIWSPVFVFACHRDFFFAVSSSYKVNEHPFVCHTRILGRVVIPSGTTGFLWPPKYVFMFAGWSRGGKKAKRKEKRKPLCSLSH